MRCAQHHTDHDNTQDQQGDKGIQPVLFEPEPDHGKQDTGDGRCNEDHYPQLDNSTAAAGTQVAEEFTETEHPIIGKGFVMYRFPAVFKQIQDQPGHNDRHGDNNTDTEQVAD